MKALAHALFCCVLSLVHGTAAGADPATPGAASATPAGTRQPSTPAPATDRKMQPAAVASAQDSVRSGALPMYTPPRRGAPKTRVGGGTRVIADAANPASVLTVLSPPQVGLTQQAQPTLYWFLSTDDPGPFEFVLTTPAAIAPLWRVRVEGPQTAGIHALSLRDQNVVLENGIEYQWSVAIVRDPQRRSRDLVTIGTLERVAGAATLQANDTDAVFALAAQGFWYDALQQVEELIEVADDDAMLREYRAALFDQADLAQVAAYVRNPAP
jgi:hypothetical protein